MTTLLFTPPDCIGHQTGEGHPESPARLSAIIAALDEPRFAGLARQPAPLGDRDAIARVHGAAFVERLLGSVPQAGRRALDPDTILSSGSGAAALRAAGAMVAAVDAVATGKARSAFCAVRPPGHHAKPDRAMGFCLFNSVAVAARHAQV